MNTSRFIRATLLRVATPIVIFGFLLTTYGALWEYSTRCYLKGFSNAVVPESAAPQTKVEAILNWMSSGPERRATEPPDNLGPDNRDPENTLNYARLLKVCGTATNAFVNLADSSGLDARRLLLIGPSGSATHVVAEVRLNNRWVIVDPAFRRMLMDPDGNLLTRQQLSDPAVLREATKDIVGYQPDYNYRHTEHLHLSGIPLVGPITAKVAYIVSPGWQDSWNWTLLVERESYEALVAGILLLLLGILGRTLVMRYDRKNVGLFSASVWAEVWQIALLPITDRRHPLRTRRS